MSKIIHGDCLEKLKELSDCSVDCCVTSPPYYGLRDYGTGHWEGGNPDCPHRRLSKYSSKTITGHAQEELKGNVGDAIYKTVCPLCGAIRVDRQIGLEETPQEYIDKLVEVFREVRRVLKDDGTLWLNIGDSYAAERGGSHQPAETLGGGEHGYTQDGSRTNRGRGDTYNPTRNAHAIGLKHKDMIGIPWMLAFALRNDGWYLRQDIIWHKPNPMPESVKDRCTKSHEYIFLLSKKERYYFDYQAIQEDSKWYEQDARADKVRIAYDGKRRQGVVINTKAQESFVLLNEKRNKRDVWSVSTQAVKEAHFATFPEKLIEPCILAGSKPGGIVLDPFFGSGTTGRVATKLNRNYIGIELNPDYIDIGNRRTENVQMCIQGFLREKA